MDQVFESISRHAPSQNRSNHTPRRDRAMATEAKGKGPASYFPSIEKTYGKPIDH